MKNLNIHYVIWLMQKTARGLGTWGLLAIALLFMSVFFLTTKIYPMQEQISALDKQLNNQASIKQTVKPVMVPQFKNNTAAQVVNFYARFPDVATLPKWLEAIDEGAIAQHLELNRGDYKLNKVNKLNTSAAEGNLTRYEILLPVKGSYIQIRKFIALILQQLPMLALSDFQIVRENVAASTVEARLLFVLFLKEGAI